MEIIALIQEWNLIDMTFQGWFIEVAFIVIYYNLGLETCECIVNTMRFEAVW